jgi:hypothetical protein
MRPGKSVNIILTHITDLTFVTCYLSQLITLNRIYNLYKLTQDI